MAYCDQKNWLLRKALKKGHLDTYNSREKTLTCEAHYKNKFYIPNNYNTFHVIYLLLFTVFSSLMTSSHMHHPFSGCLSNQFGVFTCTRKPENHQNT